WWPTGHGLGYEHTFTHQIADLVTAIGEGTDPSPSFEEALQVQRVLTAIEASSEHGSSWQSTDPQSPTSQESTR
ncbi:MAG: gfo/Idh/MocA family oxidoreductase, partial [Brachybacterium sp.]